MGVVRFDEEVTSKVAPARLFKALVTDNCNLVPKIAPNYFKSGAIIQGDGGVGSIKHMTMGNDASFPFMKYRVDELDESQFICKSTLIEGGELSDTIRSISLETKLEPTADGGCKSKVKRVFTLADGAQLDPKHYEAIKEKASKLFNAIEGYLLANPEACLSPNA